MKAAIKTSFDDLLTAATDLRDGRAKLHAERNKLGDQIREIRELPPTKSELKTILQRVLARYQEVWNRPLTQRIEHLKNGFPVDEFVERHSGLAGNDEHIADNGWTCLLGYAMSQFVDRFVDDLADWPESIPPAERAAKLAELQSAFDAVSEKVAAIDAQFSAIGLNPREPAETVL